MNESEVAVTIVALVILSGVGLMVAAMMNRRRFREMEHQERLAMIERGLVPSPESDPAGFEAKTRAVSADYDPAIRYRTGDLVRHGGYTCGCGRTFLHLPGGVLGRVDDMLIVRGVNVYPSALADVLHRFPQVTEYRVIVTREGSMDEIAIKVECPPEMISTIQEELRIALNLRIPIEAVQPGSLPRFELKARRVEDRR